MEALVVMEQDMDAAPPELDCRGLWAAVLEQAWRDALSWAAGLSGRCSSTEQIEAVAWLAKPNMRRGGFDWVCVTLDRCPEASRQQLRAKLLTRAIELGPENYRRVVAALKAAGWE